MTFKRIVGGVLVVVMLLSLVVSVTGCSAKKEDETPPPTEVVESIEEEPSEETEEVNLEEEVQDLDSAVEDSEIVEEPEAITEDALKEAIFAELDKSIFIKEALSNVAESGIIPFECVVDDVPEDYLPGFTNPVNGYHEAAMMAPTIGSHPFITYLFLAEDVDTLITDLMREADPNWNVCTEATVVVCEEYGEIVLFAMLP